MRSGVVSQVIATAAAVAVGRNVQHLDVRLLSMPSRVAHVHLAPQELLDAAQAAMDDPLADSSARGERRHRARRAEVGHQVALEAIEHIEFRWPQLELHQPTSPSALVPLDV
jgi:hypothetical protein